MFVWIISESFLLCVLCRLISILNNYLFSLQSVFIQKLEGGDRQKAMKRLRVPPLGEKVNFSEYSLC